MKANQFFEKFALIADAPDAVARMRDIVLAWAVQGKLVIQDPNDQPAIVTSDSPCDGPFFVPESWSWIHLADLQPEFQNGASSRGDKDGTPVVVVRLADIDQRRVSLENPRSINISADQIAKYRLKCGDTLITRVNGSADIVGTFIPIQESLDAIYCDHFIRMRIDQDRCFPAYTALLGDSELVREQIRRLFITTAGQKTVNQGHIRSLTIPLPPLAEQKRIVAKVDELMALCDQLEAQQQERETRKSVLVRASLARFAETPTPSNLGFLFHKSYDIPPAELRKAILTIGVDCRLLNYRGDASNLSEVVVGDVVDFLGGFAFKSEWFTTSSGFRLVRNQNIGHGSLDWSDTKYLPDERAAEFEKWALRPGDLVLSLNRPFISTGLKLAWITASDCPCLLVQRIVCLRPHADRLLPEYLFLWCNAPHFYRDAHVVPSSGVPYIAPNRVARMKMRLPPLAEQRRIVAKVEQLMEVVDELERQQESSGTTASKLLDAIVHRATEAGRWR